METWKENCVNFTFFITFRMMFQQDEWVRKIPRRGCSKQNVQLFEDALWSSHLESGPDDGRFVYESSGRKSSASSCVESSSRNEFSSLPPYQIPQRNRKLLLESRKMNFHFISAFIFGLPSTVFYVHIFRKYEFFMVLCLRRRRAMYLWRAVRFVVFTTKVLLNWVLWLFTRNYHNLDFAAQYEWSSN